MVEVKRPIGLLFSVYGGRMSGPVEESITRLSNERDEIIHDIRELQGQLDRSNRRLAEITDEIESLERVQQELLRRHPELADGSQGDTAQ